MITAVALEGIRRNRRKVARELLTPSKGMWGPVEWAEGMCLGRHSPRDPLCPPDRQALFAEAFGGK